MITIETIREKLGFDPLAWKPEHKGHEDDSIESPFSVLTDEESDFLDSYFEENRK